MASLNLDQLRTFAEVVERGSFSAAADRLDITQPAVSLQIRQLERRLGVRLIERVGRKARPTAAGAGLSLAFMADMCIAADDAKFTAAYHKLGVSPDGGGTIGVTEIVGARRALQIFLAEGSFSAQQAYEWGLLAKLVPAAELKQATRDFAARIAQNAPAAIGATKMLIHQSRSMPVQQQLDAEVSAIVDCMKHDEFRNAVDKFLGKKA